nr:MAG TPA: hypothetical protein [Caudoviricetes sp.]
MERTSKGKKVKHLLAYIPCLLIYLTPYISSHLSISQTSLIIVRCRVSVPASQNGTLPAVAAIK